MALPLITITGNFESISGVSTGSVIVTLKNFGSDMPRVSGTGFLTTQQITVPLAVGANFSTLLYGNDVILPGNTYYNIQFFSAAGTLLTSLNYQFTGSGTLDLSAQTPVSVLGVAVATIVAASVTANSLILTGATSGSTTLQAASVAGGTATLPNNTGTIAELNLIQTWTAAQTFSGGISGVFTTLQVNPGPLTIASNASAPRTATFPDNTGTIAELNLAQTWTAVQTMSANFLFSADNTFDIGASGATRPRDLFLGRNFSSAKVTTGNVNNVFYLDGTKYAQSTAGLQAALADAVTQNGGRVVVPSGAAFSITSQIVIGDAGQVNKVPVVLEIQSGAVLTIGALGGADAFLIGDACGVIGYAGVSPASASVVSPSILLNASSTCNSVFAPALRSGQQEGFFIQGINVQGHASATITSAVFDIQGVFVGTRLRDISTSTIPSKNLRIRPGTSTIKTVSDIIFDNCNFDCSGTAGGIPVSIENLAASNVANLTFIGGAIQHAGASQKLLSIDGLGVASGATNIQFYGTHFEISSGVTQPTSAVTIADAMQVTFHSCAFSGNNGVTNLFSISQTGAGLCRDITIKNIHAAGTFTNFVNNSVNVITIPQGGAFGNDIYEYSFGGASGAANANTSRKISDNTSLFVQSKAYTTTGDLTQGGFHLVPISTVNGQMTAITSAAAAGGSYGNSGASQAEAGIYFEGSGAFGTKLHLATTDDLTAGAKFRWQISPAGHLLAEVDNTFDIGATGATRPRNVFIAGNLTVGGTLSGSAAVIQQFSATVLGSDTALGTDTTLISKSVVFPAGTWRAIVHYGGRCNITGSGSQVNFYITDATNTFAPTCNGSSTVPVTMGFSGSGISPVTYSSQTVTFTLKGSVAGGGSSTVFITPGAGAGPSTTLQIEVVSSV